MTRKLIAMALAAGTMLGVWGDGITVGEPYFYTDGDDSSGNKEHALYRQSIISYDDAYANQCVAVPVYGAASAKDIVPRIAFGTAVESDFAWVKVVSDQSLFEKVAKPVWSKKANWGNRWGVDSSKLWYEWDKDIWPDGSAQKGRYWIIVAHSASSVQWTTSSNKRLGLASFVVSVVGGVNWSDRITFIREPAGVFTNAKEIGTFLRGIVFEQDPQKQMFGYTINGVAIHGFGLREASDDGSSIKTETTLELKLAEAGTLVLSAPIEDDGNLNRISKAQLKITGKNIESDTEDTYERNLDNPLWPGLDHRRIVRVSAGTKLTMKCYSWCLAFQDMAFYPKNVKSVNVRTSFFAPTPRSVAYQCGVVYGTGVYRVGETLELTALPGEGETFDHWEMSDGSNLPENVDATNNTIRFIITEEMCGDENESRTMTLRACWREQDYNVNPNSAPIHDYERPSSYGPFIAGDKVEFDVGLEGYTVKGLPSGLKYDAKKGIVSGTVKKVGEYEATFTKKNEEDVTVMFSVREEEVSVGCAGLSGGTFTAGVAGNANGIPLEIESETGVKSVAVAKLPAGMKYDTKTGFITGAPTKPGDYAVTVTVTTKSGAKRTETIAISVAALPDNVIGVFNGFVKTEDGEENLGTIQLTTTDAGKLTAKITTAAGSYSFSGTCWDKVEDGVYSATLATKKGETLTLALDSAAGWDKNQLTGSFAAVAGRPPYPVVARKNAFGKTWYFNAEGNERDGWRLSYAENAKAAALTVTLNADGSTKIAGKLGALSVSASGYADVTSLSKGMIIADFAPVVSMKEGKTTVKRVLSIGTNLWFDRSNEHPYIGSAYLQ